MRLPPVSSRKRSSQPRRSSSTGRTAHAGRRQLERQRDAVQAAAELGDGARRSRGAARSPAGRRRRARRRGARPSFRREGRRATPRPAGASPAGGDAPDGLAGRPAAPRGWWPGRARRGRRRSRASTSAAHGVDQVLAVVQHQQQALWAGGRPRAWPPAARPARSRTPSAGATAGGTRAGSASGGQLDQPDAVRVRGASGRPATRRARRVLPTPPGPVSVSRRPPGRAGAAPGRRPAPAPARRSWSAAPVRRRHPAHRARQRAAARAARTRPMVLERRYGAGHGPSSGPPPPQEQCRSRPGPPGSVCAYQRAW